MFSLDLPNQLNWSFDYYYFLIILSFLYLPSELPPVQYVAHITFERARTEMHTNAVLLFIHMYIPGGAV